MLSVKGIRMKLSRSKSARPKNKEDNGRKEKLRACKSLGSEPGVTTTPPKLPSISMNDWKDWERWHLEQNLEKSGTAMVPNFDAIDEFVLERYLTDPKCEVTESLELLSMMESKSELDFEKRHLSNMDKDESDIAAIYGEIGGCDDPPVRKDRNLSIFCDLKRQLADVKKNLNTTVNIVAKLEEIKEMILELEAECEKSSTQPQERERCQSVYSSGLYKHIKNTKKAKPFICDTVLPDFTNIVVKKFSGKAWDKLWSNGKQPLSFNVL